jgi:hypothetical protein
MGFSLKQTEDRLISRDRNCSSEAVIWYANVVLVQLRYQIIIEIARLHQDHSGREDIQVLMSTAKYSTE